MCDSQGKRETGNHSFRKYKKKVSLEHFGQWNSIKNIKEKTTITSKTKYKYQHYESYKAWLYVMEQFFVQLVRISQILFHCDKNREFYMH